MLSGSRRAVVTLVAAAVVVLAVGSGARAQTVVAEGHVDLGPRLVDGSWAVQWRDATVEPPAWREPGEVTVAVPGAARVGAPDDPGFGFLGEPGEPVWLLPEAQDDLLPWAGWSTQDLSVAEVVAGEVIWSLEAVEGPGAVTVFLTEDRDSPEVLFDSRRSLPQEVGVAVGTHGHGNWAFSAPGVYRLDVALRATGSDGQELVDAVTLRFAVGEAADAAPSPSEPTAAAPSPAPSGDARAPAEKPSGGVPAALVVVAVLAGAAALGAAALAARHRARRRGGAGTPFA